ncbi:MAG: hypothetical protein N4A33_08785 [Bacteriovoracaceae bacterium]|nr:hypothetical protein [Bacteriovoracaceae bacterium]
MSCSTFFSKDKSSKFISDKTYQKYEKVDYLEHLKEFEQFYLSTNNEKQIPLDYASKRYLDRITKKILSENKLFFKLKVKPVFYIIKDEIPFHFSLPGRRIFISTSLFQKYIKNESLLYCVLMFELIRSEKNIYKKNIIIPTGDLEIKKILSLLRLSIKQKVEVHKWAFSLLKKVDIDSDTYLSWLQIQNRNSVDFSYQLGDINNISREEAMFKAFIIENTRGSKKRNYRGSAKSFYSLLRYLRSKA